METKIIAICNNKGGTSKTATTINLGASLTEMGHKTLLIDYDPQANLTAALRVQGTPIYYTLKEKAEIKPAEIAPNLYAVPSSMELAAAETEFNNNAERNYLLADCLEPLRGAYDYILIDCAPNVGFTTITALSAADGVIIPMTAEFLPAQGIGQLLQIIGTLRRRINTRLDVTGVLIVRYDKRKTLHRDTLEMIREQYGDKVFNTLVRENVAVSESNNAGVPVTMYAPKSNGATDYNAVAKELIKRNI